MYSTGATGTCAKCVSLVLEKLNSDLENAQYVNNSTRYTTHLEHLLPHPTHQSHSCTTGGKKFSSSSAGPATGGGDALEAVISGTKITLTVPDSMIGNILGKKVCFLSLL
jgi:hypothetical protein